jgi:hypothetical protein
MPFHHVENAALMHLGRWVRGGAPAPTLPRITMRDGEVARDDDGNALGGIRLPQLDAPLAQYGPVGTPEHCALRGFVLAFEPSVVRARYGSRVDYLQRFDECTRAAMQEGFLFGDDAEEGRALAARAIDAAFTS